MNSMLKNNSILATASTPKAEEKVATGYQRSIQTGKQKPTLCFFATDESTIVQAGSWLALPHKSLQNEQHLTNA